jgi:hypothetical protein
LSHLTNEQAENIIGPLPQGSRRIYWDEDTHDFSVIDLAKDIQREFERTT